MKLKNILLVEDNPDDIALTLRAFRKNHIENEIVVAKDGIEALDYLFFRGMHAQREKGSMPTVTLLDLRMPLMNGLEVLREMRAREETRLLPVVILTSSNEESDLIESYKLGANSYVRKPVGFNEFLEAVKNLALYWLTINCTAPEVR